MRKFLRRIWNWVRGVELAVEILNGDQEILDDLKWTEQAAEDVANGRIIKSDLPYDCWSKLKERVDAERESCG